MILKTMQKFIFSFFPFLHDIAIQVIFFIKKYLAFFQVQFKIRWSSLQVKNFYIYAAWQFCYGKNTSEKKIGKRQKWLNFIEQAVDVWQAWNWIQQYRTHSWCWIQNIKKLLSVVAEESVRKVKKIIFTPA